MRTSFLLRRSSQATFKARHSSLLSSSINSRKSRLIGSSVTTISSYRRSTKATGSPLNGKRLSTTTSSQDPEGTSSSPGPPPSEPNSDDSPDANEPPNANEPPSAPVEESDRIKIRRTRTSTTLKELESISLPEGLDVLWDPAASEIQDHDQHTAALPPADMLEEALHNLYIALHPQTQHRATYPTQSGTLTEPTLALYCPIEGGEYVIDATVRELARKTGSEVVVLDAVHLAAGEWGKFGKAAKAVQLPRNPLHFPPSQTAMPSNMRAPPEDGDADDGSYPFMPSQMTLTVMTPGLQGRTVVARRSAPPNKTKLFFDSVIDVSSEQTSSDPSSSSSTSKRPRIVYIRDFTTIASSSASWYPQLLSAVRQRRRGPISRPLSPVANPMTIVFGITPPLLSTNSPPSPSSSRNGPFTNSSFSGNPRSAPANSRSGRSEWGEDEAAAKAREGRLRDRLRKWERGDLAALDEIPALQSLSEDAEGDGSMSQPDIVVVGPGGGGGVFESPSSAMGQGILGRLMSARGGESGPGTEGSRFFRTSVIVPSTRSIEEETTCRIERRREINELTMRMGIGAVGGVLQSRPTEEPATESPSAEDEQDEASPSMREDWGRRLEVWPTVRQIADHAVGSVVAVTGKIDSLEPTEVPWSAVERAWSGHRLRRKSKKAWLKECHETAGKAPQQEGKDSGDEPCQAPLIDEVIERVKQDPDLDQHELRLIPCIVDANSMQTTFRQVHLPQHTIDSVRTIVSLPLLYPSLFKQGILKEHAMTGCLLFGPPGTGKTLLVKALAKEAGCRMMSVSPSDVMDMYVGEGEKLVKAVFSLARKLSPCVVFLDEIDALFGARISSRESGGAFAHRGVITEFMQEMDGLKSSKDDNVIVIGATNRPFDLDDAVLRRLPRRLLVDLPGEKERAEILKILLRDEILSPSFDIDRLAKDTPSFSGSDLKHLCVSAALDAVKERVEVPWSTTSQSQAPVNSDADGSIPTVDTNTVGTSSDSEASESTKPEQTNFPRILRPHNFSKALKEITPSSSEALSSLVRKWNDEFGEGRKDRKRQQVWGKGLFGFVDKLKAEEDGRILPVTIDDPTEVHR